MLAEERLGEHGAEAGGQARGAVRRAEEVSGGQEGLALVVEPGDQELVPEGIELGAAAVEELGEVAVEVGGGEAGLVGGRVGLGESEVGEVAVQVLHVGDVAAEAHNRVVLEGAETLDVGETSEGSV